MEQKHISDNEPQLIGGIKCGMNGWLLIFSAAGGCQGAEKMFWNQCLIEQWLESLVGITYQLRWCLKQCKKGGFGCETRHHFPNIMISGLLEKKWKMSSVALIHRENVIPQQSPVIVNIRWSECYKQTAADANVSQVHAWPQKVN